MSATKISINKLKNYKDYDGHKKVIYFQNKSAGLKGFISIHNDNLGPAVGGTRMHTYKSKNEALVDVLRLSRAMTYKCAIARLPFGGGKAVIIGNPKSKNKAKILKAFAVEINRLKGLFYTGEDVGINEKDVQNMLKVSPYFIGESVKAGDPSPFAALSTYKCMKTLAQAVWGDENLNGKKIAIKGVGKVGGAIVEMLIKEKAKLYISDINEKRLRQIKEKFKAVKITSSTNIHKLDVDIYSPCAMGKEFKESNLDEIKAKIICGAANNQLQNNKVGDLLFLKGIVYGPDYVVNSGGLINVVEDLEKDGYDKNRVLRRIDRVCGSLKNMYNFSQNEQVPLHRIANLLSENLFLGKLPFK